MRGAITKGEAFIERDVFLGRPIVLAHEMEEKQEWAGCWIEDQCVSSLDPNSTEIIENKSILLYEIPLKSCSVKERWALNWTPLLFRGEKQNLSRLVRTSFYLNLPNQEKVRWDVERKIINTIDFLEFAPDLKLFEYQDATLTNRRT